MIFKCCGSMELRINTWNCSLFPHFAKYHTIRKKVINKFVYQMQKMTLFNYDHSCLCCKFISP